MMTKIPHSMNETYATCMQRAVLVLTMLTNKTNEGRVEDEHTVDASIKCIARSEAISKRTGRGFLDSHRDVFDQFKQNHANAFAKSEKSSEMLMKDFLKSLDAFKPNECSQHIPKFVAMLHGYTSVQ